MQIQNHNNHNNRQEPLLKPIGVYFFLWDGILVMHEYS